MKYPTLLTFLLLILAHAPTWGQHSSPEAHLIVGEPTLEIIQARQEKGMSTPPLLFIHGFRMGAWIFEDTYLPFFHHKGYDVFAINLRGHGWSEGAENIERTTLNDYYKDVAAAVAYVRSETGEEPILIGYAMGAVLTQQYIREEEPAAAILLGMGDIRAGLSSFQQWSRDQFPDKVEVTTHIRSIAPLFRDPAFNRALLFNQEEKPVGHKKYVTKMVTQSGSKRIWGDLEKMTPEPFTGKTSVLIVAGEQDPFTPPTALNQARELYGAEVVILENTRHGIPVGENWKKGAKSILRFLRQLPQAKEKEMILMGIEGN